jgi:hypothetical protein
MISLKSLVKYEYLEDIQFDESNGKLVMCASCLPYPYKETVQNVFDDGVKLDHIKTWFGGEEATSLFRGSICEETFVIEYTASTPEFDDNDWACTGTVTIEALSGAALDKRIRDLTDQFDTQKIQKELDDAAAAIYTANSPTATACIDKFIAGFTDDADVMVSITPAGDRRQEHSMANLVVGAFKLAIEDAERKTNRAHAGATIASILLANPKIEAMTIEAHAEYEYFDDGTYARVADYTVSVDDSEDEWDGVRDYLNDMDFYSHVMPNSYDLLEITVRVERKELADLLKAVPASGKAIYEAVQKTTEAYLAAKENKAA